MENKEENQEEINILKDIIKWENFKVQEEPKTTESEDLFNFGASTPGEPVKKKKKKA